MTFRGQSLESWKMAMKIMGLVVYNVAWAEAYLCTKWHLDPSSRLATIDMGQKLGATVPLFGGRWVPMPGPRHTSVPSGILIHPSLWPQQTWAENKGLCPFWGSWVPGPTCVASFILIHPTVWPQYTNVTNRQDRTDRIGQRFNSIERIVLQTDAQKTKKQTVIVSRQRFCLK